MPTFILSLWDFDDFSTLWKLGVSFPKSKSYWVIREQPLIASLRHCWPRHTCKVWKQTRFSADPCRLLAGNERMDSSSFCTNPYINTSSFRFFPRPPLTNYQATLNKTPACFCNTSASISCCMTFRAALGTSQQLCHRFPGRRAFTSGSTRFSIRGPQSVLHLINGGCLTQIPLLGSPWVRRNHVKLYT